MSNEKARFIGESIKYHRLKHNYTQEFVGQKLGIGHNGYGKKENGQIGLSAEDMLILCDLYHVGIDELIKVHRDDDFNAKNVLMEEQAPYYRLQRAKATIIVEIDGTAEKLRKTMEMLESMNASLQGFVT